MNKEKEERIKKEIEGDLRKYLENCSENYEEYVVAVRNIHPELYQKIETFDLNFNLSKYLLEIDNFRKEKDTEGEIKLLKNAVKMGIYTPATYDRLATIYEKNKELEKARNVCLIWFETDYWKLPNTNRGTLRILNKLEKIEKKYSA
jgi:hypothetical protein